MRKNFDEFSTQEAMKLAQTSAGQQLLAHLQTQHSDQMQQAMLQAKNGDYQTAMQSLSAFLSDPKTQALLRQLQEAQHERNGR